MASKKYVRELKAQAACSMRLVESSKQNNDKDEGISDAFIGDSWFASVQLAQALQDKGHEFCGIIKTAHVGSPKSQVEALMEDHPAGSYLVLVSDGLVFTGYKYNSRKVICLILTKNFQTTKPGDPYVARWVDKTESFCARAVTRPTHVSSYFKRCNVIDAHNQARQGILALEEKWSTQCCWFRLFTFFVGVAVTDWWKAVKWSVPNNCFLSEIGIKKFAEILGMEMVCNKFTTDHFGGKPVIQKPLPKEALRSSFNANNEDSSVNSDDGYVSEFMPAKVNQASDIVGSFIGDDQCIEWIKGQTIVQKKGINKCHVCAHRLPSANNRSKYFCVTCNKYVCLNVMPNRQLYCLDVHSYCIPANLKKDGRKVNGIETGRALVEYKKAQENKPDKLASTV